ncbi:MAG TPA: hypothetical protein DCY13_18075 [Verrucomicrobiales bacterium]|nr:hypothetical protein [Verrucomicrobiales bacterium]
MKTFAHPFILALASGGLSLPAVAQTPLDQFYFTAGLGGVLPDAIEIEDYFDADPGDHLRLDPGVRFDVGFGYQFSQYLAVELETGVQVHGVDSADGLFVSDAYAQTIPIMANAVFRLPLASSRIVPYAGAGVGGATVAMDADLISDGFVSVSGYDWDAAFAWQAFGGVRWLLNDQFSVGVAYRYYWVGETSLYRSDFPGLEGSLRLGSFSGHAITATVRFSF